MLALNYSVDFVRMNKNSVKTLKITNPRKIRNQQVMSLTSFLLRGEHFDSCLVVNQKGVRLNVIDGQHRILAMANYFEKFPDDKIQIALATYHNLSAEEEREVYRKWNISIKQSTDDFIHSYKETIPMFDSLTTKMPCSVYGSYCKMRLRDIVNAYIASKEHPYRGGEKKTTYDFVKYMQKMKEKDVEEIQSNFEILYAVFNSDNIKDFQRLSAFKNIVFRSLYYLAANNKDNLGERQMKRRMKSVLKDRKILNEYRRYYGRRASVDAYLAFKNLLNQTETAEARMFV